MAGCGGGGSSPPKTLLSIAVTPANPVITVGMSQQFSATGTFSDNTTSDLTTSVTWNSSATTVATISNAAGSNGRANSISAGTTTIMATSGGISGAVTLTVTPATLVSLTVLPANPNIILGTTQQFSATGTFSDSTTRDLTTSATWSSSAPTVATVSNAAGTNGLATSVSTGTTTITATSGGISGAATLTVTQATLRSLTVLPANPSIVPGTTQQFSATGIFSDTTTRDLTTSVTWSSSAPTVATVSN
ncbi:MAG: ATP-dependent DNA ligase, partial [Proteobacteria bacterium]|nr:ATP-dependent DNA ligase [Pseudomonadota bacterium]